LAVEGGERVQKDGDKEMHWDCAIMPLRVRRAQGRESTLGGERARSGWAVGSGRGRQLDARQVFDNQSVPRAWPRAVEQNKTR
jgi:hypothetical protein